MKPQKARAKRMMTGLKPTALPMIAGSITEAEIEVDREQQDRDREELPAESELDEDEQRRNRIADDRAEVRHEVAEEGQHGPDQRERRAEDEQDDEHRHGEDQARLHLGSQVVGDAAIDASDRFQDSFGARAGKGSSHAVGKSARFQQQEQQVEPDDRRGRQRVGRGRDQPGGHIRGPTSRRPEKPIA